MKEKEGRKETEETSMKHVQLEKNGMKRKVLLKIVRDSLIATRQLACVHVIESNY